MSSRPPTHFLGHHFVLPGQILATSHSEAEEKFLRGHGTYVEIVPEDDDNDDDLDDIMGGMAGTSKVKKAGAQASSAWGNTESTNVVMKTTEDEKNSDDENEEEDDENENVPLPRGHRRLIASVAGTVERVNKLISVIPMGQAIYSGQVGDLIVGRIVGVSGSRWKVSLTCSPSSFVGTGSMREGQLPLSGVNLPGGVQRIRTSEDALAMRTMFMEGDLLTCEVQNVQKDGTLQLHTRSLRYGKLENGVLVTVPPSLVSRRKNHIVSLKGIAASGNNRHNNDDVSMDIDEDDQEGEAGNIDVYLGLNGGIWIQRTIPPQWEKTIRADQDEQAPLAETLQRLRHRHATTPVSTVVRESIARVRNAIQCLRLVYCQINSDTIETVARASIKEGVRVADMLQPEWIVKLTEGTRTQ